MFTINIYKKLERLEFSIRDIKEKELDTCFKKNRRVYLNT